MGTSCIMGSLALAVPFISARIFGFKTSRIQKNNTR